MEGLTIARLLELRFEKIPGNAMDVYQKGPCILVVMDGAIVYKYATIVPIRTEDHLRQLYKLLTGKDL